MIVKSFAFLYQDVLLVKVSTSYHTWKFRFHTNYVWKIHGNIEEMNILNMEGLIKGDLGSCKKVTKEVVPTKCCGQHSFYAKDTGGDCYKCSPSLCP